MAVRHILYIFAVIAVLEHMLCSAVHQWYEWLAALVRVL